MREKRFFVASSDIRGKNALLSTVESHHLKNVLRLKKGDAVIVFNGEGQEYQGTIASLSSRVGVLLEKRRRTRHVDPISVCLAQAMPKKKKMDFIIAKACELGVSEIYPLETDRSSFRLTGPASDRVVERWQRIAVQTGKQARIDWIPYIHKPIKVRDLLHKSRAYAAVLIPHTDPNLPGLSEVVSSVKNKLLPKIRGSQRLGTTRKILLVVGPEGGFSERETVLAKEHGAHLVQLGDLILKTETAAVVGVALVKYAFNL